MKQTIRCEQGRSLLAYAVSKLRPGVFSHPVWLRFSHKEELVPPETIQDLLREAEQLQCDHPADACQVFLICAVYQNYSGQRTSALRTIQKALALAERNGLAQAILWAVWGACAICVQQGDYEQAATHLGRLQTVLTEQNEWVLANYIDVVKQSLSQFLIMGTGKHSKSTRDPPAKDLLALTFYWLQQWGFSTEVFQPELGVISQYSRGNSVQRWHGIWRDFLSAMRGEFPWKGAASTGQGIKNRSSLWNSLFGSAGPLPADRTQDVHFSMPGLQTANSSLLPPAKEASILHLPVPASEPVPVNAQEDGELPRGQATSLIPVNVQMLGTFHLMIGDTTIKLSASRGLSVLKYLFLHHRQGTPREVLMEIFWPDSSSEAARNKLNVAVHSLRQSLRSLTDLEIISLENGAYQFAAHLEILLDVEQFEHRVREGQRLETQNQLAAAVREYENAVKLYQEDFLADTPYESWTILDRERLRIAYLDTLAHLSRIYLSQEQYAPCIALCQLILTRDLCREDIHYRLMQCYSRLGQAPLALRQYQICAEALQAELEVDPAPETTQLYEQIHRREQI